MWYNKLVRDKIPDIIREQGRSCSVRTLYPNECEPALKAKLVEEVHEYMRTGDADELADILEVIEAIAGLTGVDLKAIQQQKRDERGGFAGYVFLQSVEE